MLLRFMNYLVLDIHLSGGTLEKFEDQKRKTFFSLLRTVMVLSWFVTPKAELRNTLFRVRNIYTSTTQKKTLNEGKQFLFPVRDDYEVRHYRIKKDTSAAGDPVYFISRRTQFLSLQELVQHYSSNGDGLCTTLTHPCVQVLASRITAIMHEKD